jgi:hypothetical protein
LLGLSEPLGEEGVTGLGNQVKFRRKPGLLNFKVIVQLQLLDLSEPLGEEGVIGLGNQVEFRTKLSQPNFKVIVR